MPFVIRLLEPGEIGALTDLLHRAYAELAAMNLKFVATAQTEETTIKRITGCECFVAVDGEQIVGSITLRGPSLGRGAPWYERPDVATFVQFAVDPARQGQGLGRMLLQHAEARARAMGAAELTLDTARPATHLIEMYGRWGYREVGEVDWPPTNYVSVILSKTL